MTCRCCRVQPSRQRSDVCSDCAHGLNVEKAAVRRAFERRPPCPACTAMLPGFEAVTRCLACQTLYDQMMRAAEARVALGHRGDREADSIERRLAALAARRRRQRFTLTEDDIWRRGCGVSAVYGGAL